MREMRILNVGSLNIDKVYDVDHFVTGGETIAARGFEVFCGGKGLNQSIALARAGAQVFHAGAVGPDGEPLLNALADSGVDTGLVWRDTEVSGHAIVQIDNQGQNSIIVYSGANGRVSKAYIDQVLERFEAEDLLLLQNEVSNVDYAIRQAKKQGLRVAFNPSPITPSITTYPLELVDYLIVNEIEGDYLAGQNAEEPERLLDLLAARFPTATLVLTLGGAGAMVRVGAEQYHHGSYKVKVVDTTGAGDTFCGYFLAGVAGGLPTERCLEQANMAAALAVSCKGAANSIPVWRDVETAIEREHAFT